MKIETGQLSRLPTFNGDGYGWGGELVVSFGNRAVKLGHDQYDLGCLLAASTDLLEVAEMLLAAATTEIPAGLVSLAEAAVAKARPPSTNYF